MGRALVWARRETRSMRVGRTVVNYGPGLGTITRDIWLISRPMFVLAPVIDRVTAAEPVAAQEDGTSFLGAVVRCLRHGHLTSLTDLHEGNQVSIPCDGSGPAATPCPLT